MSKRKVIFTIPIYAFDEKTLKEKVAKEISNIEQKSIGLDEDIKRRLIDHCTFPFRSWKYNHIVGYIEVSAGLNDVYFNLYVPFNKGRHYWNTTKKTLLINEGHDYTHFRVFDEDSNEQIIEKIYARLQDAKEIIPKRYYIDFESFDSLSEYVDIKSLLHDFRKEVQ